jgi:amino acid permease
MNTSSDFQKYRKHAVVAGAFAAALSAVSAMMLNDGNRIAGFVIIAMQACLVVLAAYYIVKMKGASKASLPAG